MYVITHEPSLEYTWHMQKTSLMQPQQLMFNLWPKLNKLNMCCRKS